jgi:hypothetical protein
VAAEGVYGNPVQMNPQQIAQPLVAFSGPSGERVLDPASRQMLTGTEGVRAYFDAQDMGGFSISVPGQKASHNNAFDLAFPGGEPTRENLAHIMTQGSEQGMPNVLHYGGDRGALTNFDKTPPQIGAKETKAMNKQLGDAATASPTRLESGGVFYGDEWRGGAAEGQPAKQGTDMATNKMLANLNDAQKASLDTPEVRAKVLERFDRDAQLALEKGYVVREDIQLAKKLFAEGGFKAIQDNLGKGLLPVAAAGLFLVGQKAKNRQEDAGREES